MGYFPKSTSLWLLAGLTSFSQSLSSQTVLTDDFVIEEDRTGQSEELVIFSLEPSSSGLPYTVNNNAQLESLAEESGQIIFDIAPGTSITLNNNLLLQAAEGTGSVIRISAGADAFIFNNNDEVASNNNEFVIDMAGNVSGSINNRGVMSGARLIRSSGSFNGVLNNEGTLNAGSGAVIDFSASSALQLTNSGIIQGDIIGSAGQDQIIFANGALTGNVSGVEQVSVTGKSTINGAFTGLTRLDNQGTLTTDGLTLDGAYVQSSGASLITGINEDSLTQAVVSVGSADFAVGSVISLAPDAYVLSREEDTTYKIVSSDSAINNKQQLEIKPSLFLENVVIGGSANEVDVTLRTRDIDDVIADSGLTEDEGEAYSDAVEGLVEVLEGDAGAQVQAAILEHWLSVLTNITDTGELARIAGELKPTVNGGVAALPMSFSRHIQRTLLQRTRARIQGENYGDWQNAPGSNFWGQFHYTRGSQEKSRNDNGTTIRGYDASGHGLTLGYDLELSNELLVGMAFSYGEGKADTNDSLDRLETNSYQLSLYGRRQWSDWRLNGVITAGSHSNRQCRVYEVPGLGQAEGDFNSSQLSFLLMLGKDWRLQDWLITPQAGVNYSRLRVADYTEKGDLNYRYAEQNFEVMQVGAGVELEKQQVLGRHQLTWQLSGFGWHDFAADGYQVKASYAFFDEAPWFTVKGADPEKNSLEFSAGLSYRLSQRAELQVMYQRWWTDSQYSDSGRIRFHYAL